MIVMTSMPPCKGAEKGCELCVEVSLDLPNALKPHLLRRKFEHPGFEQVPETLPTSKFERGPRVTQR